MYEKVNPSHPDKICDRIAGALVDLAYKNQENPKVAVEVLLGHGLCTIIAESSYDFKKKDVFPIISRIAGPGIKLKLVSVPQDVHLAENQEGKMRCGDNGIFRGVPLTTEELMLNDIAYRIYDKYPTDGKYIIDNESNTLVVCQSCCNSFELMGGLQGEYPNYNLDINPLGDWTGGTDVDTGAVNRKLGSDMGLSVTGGGLHGKDLSKADLSVNIYAFLKAQETGEVQEYYCAIGDDKIDGVPYSEIVEVARRFVKKAGGFERLAEWGLVGSWCLG